MRITSAKVEAVAQSITRSHDTSSGNRIRPRFFLSLFGVSSNVVSQLWNLIENQGSHPKGFSPTHLLWTMCFIKVYGREETLSTLFGCDEKTMRKWVWIGLSIISDIDSLVCSILCDSDCNTSTVVTLNEFFSFFLLGFILDQVGKQIYARQRKYM